MRTATFHSHIVLATQDADVLARSLALTNAGGIAPAFVPEAEWLFDLLESAGSRRYGGEPVSQLDHALQAATLAEAQGRDPDLVVACLLHDLGYLADNARSELGRLLEAELAPPDGWDLPEHAEASGHASAGASLLRGLVSPRVDWLIANHAEAKRYLCAVDPAYYQGLSPASRRSLEFQGGPMTAAERAAAEQHPWFPDAVALRRLDDAAKEPGRPTRSLAHFKPLVKRHVRAVRQRTA